MIRTPLAVDVILLIEIAGNPRFRVSPPSFSSGVAVNLPPKYIFGQREAITLSPG